MDVIEAVKDGLGEANKPVDRVSFDDFEEILSNYGIDYSLMGEDSRNVGRGGVEAERTYRMMTDDGAYRLELLAHASDAHGVGIMPTDFSEYRSDTYENKDLTEIFGEEILPLPPMISAD